MGSITVHHLDNSRSQRLLWLLEELELEYEIVFHKRHPIGLAPPELKAVHPLGKAPVVELDGQLVAESGAAVELITQRYGGGRLMPDPASADYVRYVELLHYPEGSAAGLLGMLLFSRIFRVENAGYSSYLASQLELHLEYIDGLLAAREFAVGNQLTAADVQLTFTLQQARRSKVLEQRPGLLAYVDRMEARDAYKRGIEKGGPFTLDIRK
jgi:glutathione S-transferase